MSAMTQRVAAALDAHLGSDHESLSIEMGCGSIAATLRAEAMTRAAISAIEAMREPTEKMLKASPIVGTGLNEHGDWSVNSEPARIVWAAMIDAALR